MMPRGTQHAGTGPKPDAGGADMDAVRAAPVSRAPGLASRASGPQPPMIARLVSTPAQSVPARAVTSHTVDIETSDAGSLSGEAADVGAISTPKPTQAKADAPEGKVPHVWRLITGRNPPPTFFSSILDSWGSDDAQKQATAAID